LTPDTVWLSCGVLRDELRELHSRGLITGELVFFSSMLHMNPPELEATLRAALERRAGDEACLVLVFGDCSARMLDLVRQFRVGRVDAINCAQLLVGRERYRQLMREEAFLILPEWGRRWEHIMKRELGLSKVVAQELMGENRGVLVYLDTALTPIPRQELADFSSYSGLPWRVEAASLDHCLAGLLEAQAAAVKVRSGKEST